MNCPNCSKEVVADRLFCHWCEIFIPNPQIGTKAGLFRRWLASTMDPIIAIIVYFVVAFIMAGIFRGVSSNFGQSNAAAVGTIFVFSIAYGIFFLTLLSKGMTPGKWLLGEHVVEKLSGKYPGFWTMILREVIGKFVSGIFLGLGYFWAIWDKDNQAWHDKIAGTVVIRRAKKATA
jgi:uncharacterized RDD family membrane protein YckC